MKRKLEIIEKICIAGIIILILVILGGLGYLWLNSGRTERTVPESEEETQKEELSGALDFMPSNLRLGEKPELNYFQDKQGNQADLQKEYNGKIKVLIFWGSWCSYCEKTLQSLKECSDIWKDNTDIDIILVNKTDAEKGESVDKAESYLAEQKLDLPCFYDKDLAGYHSYGIKRIPTILILDEEGYLRKIIADTVESEQEWQQIFEQAQFGMEYEIVREIEAKWQGSEGQVYTEKEEKKSSNPSGHDVLSESLGIMMEYAALSGDRDLFEKTDLFLQKNLEQDQIYAWYVTEEGKKATANALLDDLRIYHAFSLANELWGDQEEKMKQLSEGILKHNTKNSELYSFYDFSQKAPGKEISLNYVDFQTLKLLETQDDTFSAISENMKNIVDQGYISNTFPLYYASYNYKTGKYNTESLHTAEALLTLYHLAQTGTLKETSREWIREQLSENGLYARYETDGSVASGYEYESAAVYAIAALVGIEAKDSDIYTKAIQRMELLMKQNTETENMRVFDLLMPMLAYEYGNEVQFHG